MIGRPDDTGRIVNVGSSFGHRHEIVKSVHPAYYSLPPPSYFRLQTVAFFEKYLAFANLRLTIILTHYRTPGHVIGVSNSMNFADNQLHVVPSNDAYVYR